MHPKSAHANFVLFLCGALLLLLAVYLTVSPFADDAGMLRLVSVVLIVAGLLYALAFAQNKRWYFRPGWTLQQSFFMIFFGIILLFSADIELDSNMTVFAFFAFFTASAQMASAIQLHALDIRRWWMIALFGFAYIILGVYFLVDPFAPYITMAQSVAIYLSVTGIVSALEPFVYMKGRRHKGAQEGQGDV